MEKQAKVPKLRFPGFTGEWEERKLGEVVDFLDEQREPLEAGKREKGIYPYYGASGIIDYVKDYLFEDELILLSEDGANIIDRNSRVCFLARGKYWVNNHAHVMKSKEGHCNGFLCESLERLNYVQYNTGTAQPKLNQEVCKKILFMVPLSYTEEKMIFSVLNLCDSIIKLHQRKLAHLQKKKKSLLQKMFPKKGERFPELRFPGFTGEWTLKKLGECTELLTGYPFESKQFMEAGIKLVRGMNVKRGYLDMSHDICEYWASSKGLERYLLQKKDIVIQMDGALIGKSYAMLESEHIPSLLVQRVTRIRCKANEPDYVYQSIQKDFLNYIKGIKTETAIPHLSLNDIRNYVIDIPENTHEQKKIGSFFHELDNLIILHQRKLSHLKKQKQALLQQMFV